MLLTGPDWSGGIMNKKLYTMLLLLTLAATLGGILTMTPRAAASYPNILGYSSICTFAPAATLFCFFIAGLSCFIRATFVKDQLGSALERFRNHRKSLILPSVLLMGAVTATLFFIQVKSIYMDGSTAASF